MLLFKIVFWIIIGIIAFIEILSIFIICIDRKDKKFRNSVIMYNLYILLIIISLLLTNKCIKETMYINDDSDILRMSEQHRLYDSTTKALREQNYKEAQILKDSLERW